MSNKILLNAISIYMLLIFACSANNQTPSNSMQKDTFKNQKEDLISYYNDKYDFFPTLNHVPSEEIVLSNKSPGKFYFFDNDGNLKGKSNSIIEPRLFTKVGFANSSNTPDVYKVKHMTLNQRKEAFNELGLNNIPEGVLSNIERVYSSYDDRGVYDKGRLKFIVQKYTISIDEYNKDTSSFALTKIYIRNHLNEVNLVEEINSELTCLTMSLNRNIIVYSSYKTIYSYEWSTAPEDFESRYIYHDISTGLTRNISINLPEIYSGISPQIAINEKVVQFLFEQAPALGGRIYRVITDVNKGIMYSRGYSSSEMKNKELGFGDLVLPDGRKEDYLRYERTEY